MTTAKAFLIVSVTGLAAIACAHDSSPAMTPASDMQPSSDSDADRVPSPASNNIGGSAASTTDGPAPGNVTNPPRENPLAPNAGGSATTGPHGSDKNSPMSP